jgi:hypothetical protein
VASALQKINISNNFLITFGLEWIMSLPFNPIY